MISLNEKLNIIFDKCGVELREHRVTISRYDGVMVFTNQVGNDEDAAVTAGLWQAAVQLHKSSRVGGETGQFKLCFDSSDKGIIVRSFNLKNSLFFISMAYDEVLNPGLIKKKFEYFIDELKAEMAMFEVTQPAQSLNVKKETFLFNKLTDKEIEAAFSRIRD